MPWLRINQFVITLSGSQSLNRNEVTVGSAVGFNYGPITVTGAGATYTITLARPINQADLVTITIAGAGITAFTGTLPVLPGDFNDNAKVDYPDETGVLYEYMKVTKTTIFGEITGAGSVVLADYKYVVGAQGNTLPADPPPGTHAEIVNAGAGLTGRLTPLVLPAGSIHTAAVPNQAASKARGVGQSGAVPASLTLAPRPEIRLAMHDKNRIGRAPWGHLL
jgi:hypothetical protein